MWCLYGMLVYRFGTRFMLLDSEMIIYRLLSLYHNNTNYRMIAIYCSILHVSIKFITKFKNPIQQHKRFVLHLSKKCLFSIEKNELFVNIDNISTFQLKVDGCHYWKYVFVVVCVNIFRTKWINFKNNDNIIVIIIIASANANGHTEEELFFAEKTVEDYVSA